MLLEEKIIEHCAPTLAGMKTANMFNYPYTDHRSLYEELDRVNALLAAKDVHIEVLRFTQKNALLYVFRKKKLAADLLRDGVPELLGRYGYRSTQADECLDRLRDRLAESPCFPHEIGVFLDYPLADVTGFIEQGGKNCKCCGIWKVYCNERETLKLFDKFRRCTQVYRRTFAAGRSLSQMTVPVKA